MSENKTMICPFWQKQQTIDMKLTRLVGDLVGLIVGSGVVGLTEGDVVGDVVGDSEGVNTNPKSIKKTQDKRNSH